MIVGSTDLRSTRLSYFGSATAESGARRRRRGETFNVLRKSLTTGLMVYGMPVAVQSGRVAGGEAVPRPPGFRNEFQGSHFFARLWAVPPRAQNRSREW